MHATSLCNILCACVCVCITGILTQHLSLRFDDKIRDRTKLQILFPFPSLCFYPLIQSSLSTQCAVDNLLPSAPPSFSSLPHSQTHDLDLSGDQQNKQL